MLRLVKEGIVKMAISVESEVAALEALMERYSDKPMSIADACLVRLSERFSDCLLFTLDKDFQHYRRHGRRLIPLLTP